MVTPGCRPFKLADGMILIAAAAAWMGLMRDWWSEAQTIGAGNAGVVPWQFWTVACFSGLSAWFWVLSGAYIAMRSIRPRPSWSELIPHSGVLFLALMMALAMLVWMSLHEFLSKETVQTWAMVVYCLAFALSWIITSCRDRSRFEPGWIEDLGRTLEVGWIVIFTLSFPLLHVMLSSG